MADRDPLSEAIETIAAAATPDRNAMAGRHFSDPLSDAFSVAAASLGESVRPPDPQVEGGLPARDAIAAASGLMTHPVAVEGRWWTGLPGPAVAGADPDCVAVLPDGRGATAVTAITRHSRRVSGRTGVPRPAVAIAADLPGSASWRGLLRWSVRNQRTNVWALVLLSLVGGLAGLLLPLAAAALFGYALPIGSVSTIAAVLAAFAIGSAGAAVTLLARNMTLLHLRDVSDATLATSVTAHALRLPLGFFRRMTPGDVLNRLLTVEQARALVDDSVPTLLLTAAFGLVNLLVLIVISPLMALLVAAVLAVVVAATLRTQVRARAALSELLEARSASDADLMALADCIVPIRVAGAEARALSRWSRGQSRAIEALQVRMKALDAQAPLTAAGPLLVTLVLIVSVIVAGTDAVPLPQFMPAYAAVVQLTVAMGLMTQNLVHLWELGPTFARVAPITTTPVERPGERRPPGVLRGGIELRDVVFGYDTQRPPLFDGLSLSIEAGEFVAVVGPSGSGKSTLLRLILGFEEPWSGVVTYDGKDLADLDVLAVRRQIGTVMQGSVPFGESVRECVCGPRVLSDDELWRVLDRAGLADDVRLLPSGLDTPIGNQGGTVSGGQLQRLMIARALAASPRIMLLDEATSALDNLAQDVVMDTIERSAITRVTIAHRLTTIARADRVVVVSGGRIVESGRPEELRARDGHFARLAARQEL